MIRLRSVIVCLLLSCCACVAHAANNKHDTPAMQTEPEAGSVRKRYYSLCHTEGGAKINKRVYDVEGILLPVLLQKSGKVLQADSGEDLTAFIDMPQGEILIRSLLMGEFAQRYYPSYHYRPISKWERGDLGFHSRWIHERYPGYRYVETIENGQRYRYTAYLEKTIAPEGYTVEEWLLDKQPATGEPPRYALIFRGPGPADSEKPMADDTHILSKGEMVFVDRQTQEVLAVFTRYTLKNKEGVLSSTEQCPKPLRGPRPDILGGVRFVADQILVPPGGKVHE